MERKGIYRLAGALGLALLAFSRSADAKPSQGWDAPDGYAGVQQMARALGTRLGWSPGAIAWFERMAAVQAWSESKGNRDAANTTASEREAARDMFERGSNRADIEAALGGLRPSVDAWYTPGSGGWFGLMAPTVLNMARGRDFRSLRMDARWIFDPWQSTAGYLAYLQALMRRAEWSRSSQDAYALKIGGAAGSLMDDPDTPRSKVAAKHVDDAVASLGIPTGWATERVPDEIRARPDWAALLSEGPS